MRLRSSIDAYDIDLDVLEDAILDLRQRNANLEELSHFMGRSLEGCRDEFTSVNYGRVEQAFLDFREKLTLMREELEELSESCRELGEKMENIFR